ncbi:hypothetical protein D3C87_1379180 [compost metagenome]
MLIAIAIAIIQIANKVYFVILPIDFKFGDNNLKPKRVKKKNGIPTAKNINKPNDQIGYSVKFPASTKFCQGKSIKMFVPKVNTPINNNIKVLIPAMIKITPKNLAKILKTVMTKSPNELLILSAPDFTWFPIAS